MPLLEIPVPNLLGGVSQQPAANRQPGQVTACDNALLHVVNGLGKRKGSRHLAKLITGLESVLSTHFINRDAVERYAVLLGERRLRVFNAIDGTEYPVKVNGTATDSGRGAAGTGTPLAYLDPRVPGGELDQDEDFVIGAGDWLTVAANSVTSYVAGRGPFNFGRRESLVTVNADTVAEVGNGAAATVSDIYQAFGIFTTRQALSVYAKKSSSAINDFELVFADPTFATFAGARFDVSPAGVITVGAVVESGSNNTTAAVESVGNGWYRCTVRVYTTDFPLPFSLAPGGTRDVRIRFHTNAAAPANKRLLLFGGRVYDALQAGQVVPAYIVTRPDQFRALTIADSTFVLNTEKTVAMTAGVTANNALKLFVWVRQGGIDDVSYSVKVYWITASVPNSATFTFATTPTTAQTDNDIAEGLRALIDANADLIATRVGSIIKIVHTSAAATNAVLSVECTDSRGDQSMVPISQDVDGYSFVTKFTDLPLIGDDGHVVKINGNPESAADDYWAKFVGDSAGVFGRGHWEESLQPGVTNTHTGISFRLDSATMPQILTRRQDNAAGAITGKANSIYFDVSAATWEDRLVGDLASSPNPFFVGNQIADLYLYRGRLGFLSEDHAILSEAGEVFNFFRTTVIDLLDPDPIDVSSGVRDVVLFKNAAATADTLLIFSDRHEFQLLGEPTLTPASAQLSPTRAFAALTQARPVDAGRGIVFAKFDGTFSGLHHAALIQQDVSFRFEELTAQAPRFIAGAITQLAYSSLTELCAAVADGSRSVLYLHQSFFDDQENRLQSAPHRWVFQADTLIKGFGFLDADLVMIVERAQGWFLESVRTNSETTEGGRPITHLDRRVTQAQVGRVYDGGTNKTTITLPYTIVGTMEVVDAVSGLIVPIVSQTSTEVVVTGDMTATNLFVGESYTMSVTLTEPVIQDASPRGGLIPRMGRPLDVHRLYLYLADTAFLEVEVAEDLRPLAMEEFSAAGLGTGLLLEGTLTLYTGDADFAILGQSTQIDVSITNDTPFPSFVQSARWEVLHRQRAGLT